MSIHDRDCYHDRPFRPPRDDGWRLFRGLALVAVAVVLVVTFGRGLKDAWSAAAQRQVVRSHGMPTSTTVQRTTHRCILDGTIVYEGPNDCSAYTAARAAAPPPPIVYPPEAEPAPSPKLTAYQREMLRSADARIARDEANARTEMLAMHRQAAEPRGGGCEALEREISLLDAWARQPLSGSQQDHIRARRQEARSRQSSLHC